MPGLRPYPPLRDGRVGVEGCRLNFVSALVAQDVAQVQLLMGTDFWRYGVAENAAELRAFLRYARADGLINRDVAPTELFAASTCDHLRF